MKVIICPGIHDSQLSDRFIASLARKSNPLIPDSIASDWLLFPTDRYSAYSPLALYSWLKQQNVFTEELFFISFSAGVVATMGAIVLLQGHKIKIKALVAIDGWGVPLWGNFPIYRLSHDYFTHWSSALLGTGKASFYSEPPVAHLTMWETPENCQGWIVKEGFPPLRSNLRAYLLQIIMRERDTNR